MPRDLLVFEDFSGGMDSQSSRQGLDPRFAAFMENLQPIARNKLQAMPGPAAALTSLTNETITVVRYATFVSIDWLIAFCQSGAAYAINLASGAKTKFAPAGTFSQTPDAVQFASSRVLIFDSQAGYSTWDNVVFAQQGGVSPNITVTAGGSGYTSGATVAITTSGNGINATATATVVSGVVTAVVLTNAGTGFASGDTVTFTINAVAGGSGATATGHIWPFVGTKPTTGCVAFGRVWLANGRTIILTGTGGFDDFSGGNASLTTTNNDSDLAHSITALRFLNNSVFIVGDNSVKSVGSISVSGSTTSFNTTTLSSDQGTIYQNTIISYNRLLLFANTVGVFAVFGASVEKISDHMDGIFQLIDFSQQPVAAVNDIDNIHTYLLLVRYKDPALGTRSLMLAYFSRKWFLTSQGGSLITMATAIIGGITETFATSGNDITQILQSTSVAVSYTLKTALTHHSKPVMGKRIIRGGVAATIPGGSNDIVMTAESERGSQILDIAASNVITITNNAGAIVTVKNNAGAVVTVTSTGFLVEYDGSESVSGIWIGATLTGSTNGTVINMVALEYDTTSLWQTKAL